MPERPIKLLLVVVDDRFDRDLPVPFFGTAPTALLKGFEAIGSEQIEVHVVSCVPRPLPNPEKLGDNIWFHGIHVPKWGFLRTLHSGCIRAVRKKAKEIQPDIVHAQGSERWCAVTAMCLPYPRLLTLHGILRVIDPLMKLQPRAYWKLQTFLERIAIPRFDGLVCITTHTREAIEDLAKRTWLIPNATEPAYFEIENTPTRPQVILYVGSIYGLKNQIGFVEAVEPLSRKHDFIVRFCGSLDRNTPYGRDLGVLIDKYPWCEEAGRINRDELADELKQASMLALTSFEDNCPMVILEAMSAGVPVVAGAIGGIPDLVEDEKTGLLCNPHQPKTITDAVERLLSDSALCHDLAEEAKTVAKRRYTPEAVAREHLIVYKKLLK